MSATVGTNETIDWYATSSGGVAIATNSTTYMPTMAGTYYAETRNTITQCVSSTRTAIVLIIKPTPNVTAASNSPICAKRGL